MLKLFGRTAVVALLLTANVAHGAEPTDWAAPMKQVRARFTGTPGTFATFGDSITVTMAFWAPLRGEPKNMPPDMAAAHALVKEHMRPECWAAWKGPKFGNNGSMTVRWAHENVGQWLKDHNPEVAVILFGTNDLGALGLEEFEQKTREVVDRCLTNGTVAILTTLPPRSGHADKAKQFADAVRRVARDKRVPLIDYHAEVLKRRPDDWDGALPKFKDVPGSEYEVPTLIARDGVHPSNPKAHSDYSDGSLSRNGYGLRNYLTVIAYADVIRKALPADDAASAALRKAATFYASFDEEPRGDSGGGDLRLGTRFNSEKEKGKFDFEKGYDKAVFRVAWKKGVHGGALECVDVLPRNGRVYFPAKGNLAFRKGGWGGAVSVWVNTDPDKLLKTTFCDPVQITQKGANNGGIWFDFNNAKPRDLRHGAFPAVPEGGTPIKEEGPDAPMVRVPRVGFKAGDWHHVVLSWANFDTGRKDAVSTLYIDGRPIGAVKDRAIAMDWDVDKAGIYVAVNYIGLLDELAVFNRPLSADEVDLLRKSPGLFAAPPPPLPKKSPDVRAFLRKMEQQLDQQLAQGQTGGDGPLESTRTVILRALTSPRGRAVAEPTLDLLLRIPPRSTTPPAAPKFPFDAEAAGRYQQAYADWLGLPVEFTNGVGIKFVLVPPGTFRMGSLADEPGHNAGGFDETPHEVTLTRPFYLGKHEVTVAQFRWFVEETRHVTDGEKAGGGHAHDAKAVWIHRPGTNWRNPGYAGPLTPSDDHPVVHVSHADAVAFCRWLQECSAGTGAWAYGLPTEAQWEWACRAGSGARYWWGPDEDATGKVANVGDRSLKRVHPDWPRAVMAMDDGHAFPAPVGGYRANGFGLCDMLGNVWEFCGTHYGPYPKGPVTDPAGGDPKRGFAVRGGGWSNVAADVRCATRNADPPHFCHSNLGFRVALAIPPRN